MNIELRGVEFVNKGAELMLHAILNYVKAEIPEAKFIMETTHRSPKIKLDSVGIWEKSNFKKRGINFEWIAAFLPQSYFNKRRIVLESDIDVIFDASGFAYGDKWGAQKAAVRSGDHLSKWKSQGKKVIFLPQAFGPFSSQEIINEMAKILKYADLVFARDSQSLHYLKLIDENPKGLFLAPDFTNLVTVERDKIIGDFFDKTLIIPNQKMLETDDPVQNEGYLPFLTKLINLLIEMGETPVFLIHESKKDSKLAQEINKSLSQPLLLINEEDPLKVKAIIGSSKAVVTSRFHGLVSALSQGIPCLSTGWSHKYKELMKDYDYEQGLCEVTVNPVYLREKLDSLFSETSRIKIIEKLQEQSKIQKVRSNEMWKKVIELLKEK